MKINQTTVIALLSAGVLLALNPAARAEDTATNSPSKSETRPSDNRQGGPRFSPERQLERLSEELKLTDEQKPKVKAILEEQSKEREGFRDLSPEERRTKGRALREAMGEKLKPILTDEQFKKWESMRRGPRPQDGAAPRPAD